MGNRAGRWFNRQRIGGLFVLLFSGLLHAGTVTYVYTDPQGTVLMETDANGNITARYDYTPYGTAVASMSPAPNGPGYTGHVNDPDTGLVYMQARYYDPTMGRFLSADPINPVAGNLHNFNRYGYANNNPVNNTDPDGRCVDADWSCGAMARSFAQHPEATKPLVPYAIAGVGVMATASGAGAAVVYVKTAIMVDKVLSETPAPSVPKTDGNTNPYTGSVDAPVIVVDKDGNAIPVNTGQSIGASKNGDYQQVKGVDGRPTGDRLDRGGHRTHSDPQSQQPHAHRPGITGPDGNPHLPIKPPTPKNPMNTGS